MATSSHTSITFKPVFCSRCRQTLLNPGRTGGWCGPCTRRSRIEREAYAFVGWPHQPWVVLDIETTGLKAGSDEIVDLAILFADGTPLFSSLVRPLTHHVNGSQAQQIHHIRDQELLHAPTFAEIWPRVENLLRAVQTVIVYNAPFAHKMLARNVQRAKLSLPGHLTWWCLMDAFAHWHGQTHTLRRGSYENTIYLWQQRGTACQELGIETRLFLSEHRALGDAQRSHAILMELAKRLPERERRKWR